MSAKGIVLDQDLKLLIKLLLRKCAKDNANWKIYDNVDDRVMFEISNRGLTLLGEPTVSTNVPQEKK